MVHPNEGLRLQELLLVTDNFYKKMVLGLHTQLQAICALNYGLRHLHTQLQSLAFLPKATIQKDTSIQHMMWFFKTRLYSSLLFIPIYTITSGDISSQYHSLYTMDTPYAS